MRLGVFCVFFIVPWISADLDSAENSTIYRKTTIFGASRRKNEEHPVDENEKNDEIHAPNEFRKQYEKIINGIETDKSRPSNVESSVDDVLKPGPDAGNSMCDNAKMLLRTLSSFKPLLRNNNPQNVETSDVLNTFKDDLESRPREGNEDNDVTKIINLMQTLEKRESNNGNPSLLRTVSNGDSDKRNYKAKVAFKYEVPSFANADCTAALLKIVKLVQDVVDQLVKNPVCQSQVSKEKSLFTNLDTLLMNLELIPGMLHPSQPYKDLPFKNQPYQPLIEPGFKQRNIQTNYFENDYSEIGLTPESLLSNKLKGNEAYPGISPTHVINQGLNGIYVSDNPQYDDSPLSPLIKGKISKPVDQLPKDYYTSWSTKKSPELDNFSKPEIQDIRTPLEHYLIYTVPSRIQNPIDIPYNYASSSSFQPLQKGNIDKQYPPDNGNNPYELPTILPKVMHPVKTLIQPNPAQISNDNPSPSTFIETEPTPDQYAAVNTINPTHYSTPNQNSGVNLKWQIPYYLPTEDDDKGSDKVLLGPNPPKHNQLSFRPNKLSPYKELPIPNGPLSSDEESNIPYTSYKQKSLKPKSFKVEGEYSSHEIPLKTYRDNFAIDILPPKSTVTPFHFIEDERRVDEYISPKKTKLSTTTTLPLHQPNGESFDVQFEKKPPSSSYIKLPDKSIWYEQKPRPTEVVNEYESDEIPTAPKYSSNIAFDFLPQNRTFKFPFSTTPIPLNNPTALPSSDQTLIGITPSSSKIHILPQESLWYEQKPRPDEVVNEYGSDEIPIAPKYPSNTAFDFLSQNQILEFPYLTTPIALNNPISSSSPVASPKISNYIPIGITYPSNVIYPTKETPISSPNLYDASPNSLPLINGFPMLQNKEPYLPNTSKKPSSLPLFEHDTGLTNQVTIKQYKDIMSSGPILSYIPDQVVKSHEINIPNTENEDFQQNVPGSEKDIKIIPDRNIIAIINENIDVIEQNVPQLYFNAMIRELIEKIRELINLQHISVEQYVNIINLYKNLIENIKNLNMSNEILKKLLLSMTNGVKLELPVGKSKIIELTYLIKRPTPVIYQPYYYIKYILPYTSFMTQLEKILTSKPNLRTNLSKLHEGIVVKSKLSEVSPDLEVYDKEDIHKLTLNSGTLVGAKVVKGKDVDMYDTLDKIKEINVDFSVEDIFRLVKNLDVNLKNKNGQENYAYEIKPNSDINKNILFKKQLSILANDPSKFTEFHKKRPMVTSKTLIAHILNKMDKTLTEVNARQAKSHPIFFGNNVQNIPQMGRSLDSDTLNQSDKSDNLVKQETQIKDNFLTQSDSYITQNIKLQDTTNLRGNPNYLYENNNYNGQKVNNNHGELIESKLSDFNTKSQNQHMQIAAPQQVYWDNVAGSYKEAKSPEVMIQSQNNKPVDIYSSQDMNNQADSIIESKLTDFSIQSQHNNPAQIQMIPETGANNQASSLIQSNLPGANIQSENYQQQNTYSPQDMDLGNQPGSFIQSKLIDATFKANNNKQFDISSLPDNNIVANNCGDINNNFTKECYNPIDNKFQKINWTPGKSLMGVSPQLFKDKAQIINNKAIAPSSQKTVWVNQASDATQSESNPGANIFYGNSLSVPAQQIAGYWQSPVGTFTQSQFGTSQINSFKPHWQGPAITSNSNNIANSNAHTVSVSQQFTPVNINTNLMTGYPKRIIAGKVIQHYKPYYNNQPYYSNQPNLNPHLTVAVDKAYTNNNGITPQTLPSSAVNNNNYNMGHTENFVVNNQVMQTLRNNPYIKSLRIIRQRPAQYYGR